jgi:2,3-bisphosphoglycerate-dependent phosphoglycerate mutase
MITNVYFVRHAEADYSIRDDKARPLTQKGEIAAQKLVNYFEDIGIEVVLSSPYKRAIDTIKPYADKSGLQIEEVFEFRERTVDRCWIEDFKGF